MTDLNRYRGKIYHDEQRHTWTCKVCGLDGAKDQPDPCLGCLPGVAFACCGHGYTNGYIAFENGVTIRARKMDIDNVTLHQQLDGSFYPPQGLPPWPHENPPEAPR